MDEALEIVTLEKHDNLPTLRLNHENLQRILAKTGNRKLSVISIAGPFGTGKSFVLSLIIRYLESLEKIPDDSDWLLPENQAKLKGFVFKSSVNLVTPGIHMWSRPFINSNGTALLLVDTRGIFEEGTSLREWAGIIGTTLALSSWTIFNVSRNVQDDSLVALETFLQYAKIISGLEEGEGCSGKCCQGLMFLVRDWNNPDEYNYGHEDGERFIKVKLSEQAGMTEEAGKVRAAITSSVDKFDCFLLPHPGENITYIEHNKPVDEDCLDERFGSYLRQFISDFIVEENIQPKIFPDGLATAPLFLSSIEAFIHTFNSTFTSQVNTIDAAIQLHNELAILRGIKLYESTVERKLRKKNSFKVEHLEKIHKDLKPYLLQEFMQRRNYDPHSSQQYLAQLDQQLELSFQKFQKALEQRLSQHLETAERESLAEVVNQLDKLSLSGGVSSSTFESKWREAENESLKNFEEKLKDTGKACRGKSLEQFQWNLRPVYEQYKLKNEQLLSKLMEDNEDAPIEAFELYESRMMAASGRLYRESSSYIPSAQLHASHEKCSEAALAFLHKKAKIPPNLQFLLEKMSLELSEKMEILYEQFKNSNEKNLEDIEASLAQTCKEIIDEFKDKIDDVLTLDVSPQLAMQQTHTIHGQQIKEAAKKFRPRLFSEVDKEIVSGYHDQALTQLKAYYEDILAKLQSLIDGKKQAEDELLHSSLRNFQERVERVTSNLLDPKSLDELLRSEKAKLILEVQSEVKKSQSDNVNSIVAACSVQADKIIVQISESKNAKFHQVQKEMKNLLKSATDDFKVKLERKMGNSSTATEEEVKIAQNAVKSEVLRNFSIQAAASLPSDQLQKFKDQLELEVQAAATQYVADFNQEFQESLDKAIAKAEESTKTFTRDVEAYTSKYHLNGEEAYESETKSLQKKFCRKLKTELLSELNENVVSEALQRVLPKLQKLVERHWNNNVVDRNEQTRKELDGKFKEMKDSYAKACSSAQDTRNLPRESRFTLVDRYLRNYNFSEDSDRTHYKKIFEKCILQVEQDLQNKTADTNRGASQAQSEATEKFQRSVPGKDETGLKQLYQDCLQEFSQAVNNDEAFVSNCSKELQRLLERAVKDRAAEAEAQLRKAKDALEEIMSESQSAISPDNMSEQEFKDKYLRKIDDVSKQHGLDLSSHGAYQKELLDRLNNNWKEMHKRMEMAKCSHQKLSNSDRAKLVSSATKHYRNLMLKHFGTPTHMLPDHLSKIHSNAVREAISEASSSKLDSETDRELYKALDTAFKEFDAKNKMNTPASVAVGIDLGTTYSCVGVYVNGKVEIIPNEQGKKTTPSYVYIDTNGVTVVGEEAKGQSHMYPERTIYEVKRLIGRKIDDPVVQEDIAKWPFKVVNERGVPTVNIEDKTYHPVEISSHILRKMKEIAEKYLKQPVKAAVITVPAYFNDGQRAATKAAGEAAGLEVLRIINEPTAAAIAYNLNWTGEKSSSKGLVYDLGGGTFDVAIYEAKEGSIDIIGVGGDTHLGGVDFDIEMLNYCVNEFKEQTGHDLTANQGSQNLKESTEVNRRLMRLKKKCEESKILLTGANHVMVDITAIYKHEDMNVRVDKTQFENMIENHIKNSLDHVTKALDDKNVSKDSLDKVVLIGGSTRIPKVQEMLHQYFGKKLTTDVNPDEAVAIGAAFEAAVLNGTKAQARGDVRAAAIAPKGLSIKDVTPMSYGLEIEGGKMDVLIPKQSQVPVEKLQTYLTAYNNQTSVQIVIYEGDDPIAQQNTLVGEFYLNGIPPGRAGEHQIKVTMKVNQEGIINVSAACKKNGVLKELTVRTNKRQLTSQQIQEIRSRNV